MVFLRLVSEVVLPEGYLTTHKHSLEKSNLESRDGVSD